MIIMISVGSTEIQICLIDKLTVGSLSQYHMWSISIDPNSTLPTLSSQTYVSERI